ncbi:MULTISPECIES: hypothetical protein [Leptolyngbya]|uniref:hypothetical protein n=1 Tax=Leptolyngbya TaxID=47251 RepID=UPI001687413C|nr:hypothetical protein [Leptolyngbya sp. FACHB-1624]MBD1857430.1 hypothetical protein [Leptolyngbya sp. FACHB-1624]
MQRKINPKQYRLPYDTIDLNKQRVFVQVGGRFHEIPNARISLIESEPEKKVESSVSDQDIINALV